MVDDDARSDPDTAQDARPPPAWPDGTAMHLAFQVVLADGTVAESADVDAPLELTLGDGTLVPAIEARIRQLPLGLPQTAELAAGEAFGFWDASNIHQLARHEFAETPKVGEILAFTLPTGEEVPGAIRAVSVDHVEVDFNHPLAGHPLHLELHLLQATPPSTN